MDKLSEHAIRMLEIADANDISVIENKQFRDIAKAIYDTILQVQVLKTALLHKTESNLEKPNNSTISKMEQVDKPQTEMEKSGSRAVLTARCLNCHNAKACKENNWQGCRFEPIEGEPQTEYERGYRQGKEDEINKHHVGR